MTIRLLMDWGNHKKGEVIDMGDDAHARQMLALEIAADPSTGSSRVIRLEKGEEDVASHR